MMQNLQLRCGCRSSVCSPVTCDHVYLFGNDFEDARDIYGKSMRFRFPYNDKQRIILEVNFSYTSMLKCFSGNFRSCYYLTTYC